jgi:hypothetical protein
MFLSMSSMIDPTKTDNACRMHKIDLGKAGMRWILSWFGVGFSYGVVFVVLGFGLRGNRFCSYRYRHRMQVVA